MLEREPTMADVQAFLQDKRAPYALQAYVARLARSEALLYWSRTDGGGHVVGPLERLREVHGVPEAMDVLYRAAAAPGVAVDVSHLNPWQAEAEERRRLIRKRLSYAMSRHLLPACPALAVALTGHVPLTTTDAGDEQAERVWLTYRPDAHSPSIVCADRVRDLPQAAAA